MHEQAHAPFGTAVQPFTEPRPRLLQLDFLLLVATLGLIVFSVITLNGAITSNSNYFVTRQIAYGVVGLVLMLIVTRFDYSRFRELRLALYGTAIGLIL